MPAPIAARLKASEERIADRIENLSVLFADLVSFTPAAHDLPPEEIVGFLDSLVRAFDALAEQHGVEKIKTVGDSYMAAAGFDGRGRDGAVAIGRFALAMLEANAAHPPLGGRKLELRVGIHCGPATAGVIGDTRFSYDVWGDAVNVAARMESHGAPGRIQVSEAFRQLTARRVRVRGARRAGDQGDRRGADVFSDAARRLRHVARVERERNPETALAAESRLSLRSESRATSLLPARQPAAGLRLRPSACPRGPRRSPGRPPSWRGGSCRDRRSRAA